jgi:hypothetical protein
MPPVSGGGICLAKKFKMIEPFDIARNGTQFQLKQFK